MASGNEAEAVDWQKKFEELQARSTAEIQEAQREIQEARRAMQLSTLTELLAATHEHFQERFVVEPNSDLRTQGTYTKPTGRMHPRHLKPWSDFPGLQEGAFETMSKKLEPANEESKRLFTSLHTIREMGRDLIKRTIKSEQDLTNFQHTCIDNFVSGLVRACGYPVSVHNSLNALQPELDHETHPASRATDHSQAPPGSRKADQFYVTTDDRGNTQMVFAGELKPPHKLTLAQCQEIMGNGLKVDVKKVRDALKTPNGDMEKARELIAIVTCQVYDYMLNLGCMYGCIITGELIIFLGIKKEDPTVLRYHLTSPREEVNASIGEKLQYFKTAIAQLASFALVALKDGLRDQRWQDKVTKEADRWIPEPEAAPKNTPKKERERNEAHEDKDTTYTGSSDDDGDDKKDNTVRSPHLTRKRSRAQCKPNSSDNESVHQDSDEEGQGRPRRTSRRIAESNALSRKHNETETQKKSNVSSRKQKEMETQKKWEAYTANMRRQPEHEKRPYCTQACLLGLANGLAIDPSCPNAKTHPRSSQGHGHSISKRQFCKRMRAQLIDDRDHDFLCLQLEGSRGVLFKVTSTAYGYVFVAKATLSCYIPDLRHEGRVYEYLHDLQGSLIPVYLGNIDLGIPWYGRYGPLVHLLMMSYAGKSIGYNEMWNDGGQRYRFDVMLQARGVRHADLDVQNMLRCDELGGKFMFIDFERSIIKVPQGPAANTRKRKALQELKPTPGSLNKKVKTEDDTDTTSPRKAGLKVESLTDGNGDLVES
ncbi:MAG: hypothetical protein Q9202_007320 [Teloschistes flavicans]